jgi:hypothetical protein
MTIFEKRSFLSGMMRRFPQLGPRERTRLHNLITDPETANDPSARDKNVKDAIAVFLRHQVWEKEHPGKLWDAPGSMFPN